tara:strand:+ start:77 stop:430 length:354 start_codon:yes stop_codon:yes gene_type:complete
MMVDPFLRNAVTAPPRDFPVGDYGLRGEYFLHNKRHRDLVVCFQVWAKSGVLDQVHYRTWSKKTGWRDESYLQDTLQIITIDTARESWYDFVKEGWTRGRFILNGGGNEKVRVLVNE